jgi:polar amino acid transport system substrate-binding protein
VIFKYFARCCWCGTGKRRYIVFLYLLAIAPVLPLVAADEILISSGIVPPFVNADKTGLDITIVTAVLNKMGYSPRFELFDSFERGQIMMGTHRFQGGMPLTRLSGAKVKCLSEPYNTYQNVAITLLDNNYPKMTSLDDIKRLSQIKIMSFQKATRELPAKFVDAVHSNGKHYEEVPDLENVVKMFFSGRADLIIIETKVFDYYRKKIADSPDQVMTVDSSKVVVKHQVLSPIAMSIGFKDIKMCAAFNRYLMEIKKSGEYQAIISSWKNHKRDPNNKSESYLLLNPPVKRLLNTLMSGCCQTDIR